MEEKPTGDTRELLLVIEAFSGTNSAKKKNAISEILGRGPNVMKEIFKVLENPENDFFLKRGNKFREEMADIFFWLSEKKSNMLEVSRALKEAEKSDYGEVRAIAAKALELMGKNRGEIMETPEKFGKDTGSGITHRDIRKMAEEHSGLNDINLNSIKMRTKK